MDDWGFGIWVVPIALSAALCFAVADQIPVRSLGFDQSVSLFLVGLWVARTGGNFGFDDDASCGGSLEIGATL